MKENKKIERTFKKFILSLISRLILVITIIVGLVIALIVRNNIINNKKEFFKRQIKEYQLKINSELGNRKKELDILSTIIQSQINMPRVYVNFSSLMRNELLSWPYYKRFYILLNKGYTIKDTTFYRYKDSLQRINISWVKNDNGVILIDQAFLNENELAYKISVIKSQPLLLKNTYHGFIGEDINYSIVLPLYSGTTFIGVIGSEFSTGFLDDIIATSQYPDNVFISNAEGFLLNTRIKQNSKGKDIFYIIPEFKKYEEKLFKAAELELHSSNNVLFYQKFDTGFGTIWAVGMLIPNKEIYRKANIWFISIMLFFIILNFIVKIFLSEIINKVEKHAVGISEAGKQLSEGDLNVEIPEIKIFKEIYILTNSLKLLQNRLSKLINILQQIKEQKTAEKLEVISEKDQLALKLQETLKSIEERRIKRFKNEEEKKKDQWINEGLNKLYDATKIKTNSLEELANKVNENITVYSDAFLSVVYIKRKEQDKEFLEAISTIGLGEQKAFKRKIDFGEGIVGTIALEKKMLYFDKIPEDYHLIVTGLSMMKPKSIMVLPLIYEDEIYGVIELGFLKILKDYEIKFFEQASAEIALSIRNIINDIRTEKLLEQMKQQNIEIEKTQKQLEKHIKELRRKEREAQQKELELKAIITAVNNTLLTIEYSTDGTLITANDRYLKTMHYTLNELRGVNVLDLVKTERVELENIIRRVSNGESLQKIVKRYTKYGEVKWLYSTYTPYYNAEGKITKILYFAFDITETQKYIEKLEKEIKLLNLNKTENNN